MSLVPSNKMYMFQLKMVNHPSHQKLSNLELLLRWLEVIKCYGKNTIETTYSTRCWSNVAQLFDGRYSIFLAILHCTAPVHKRPSFEHEDRNWATKWLWPRNQMVVLSLLLNQQMELLLGTHSTLMTGSFYSNCLEEWDYLPSERDLPLLPTPMNSSQN